MSAGQPPPRHVAEFTSHWKDWLYFLYRKIENTDKFLDTTDVSDTYTITDADEVILANADSGSFTVTLPEVSDKRMFYIKNTTTSGAGVVTVVPSGSDTLDGAAGFTLYPLSSIHVIYSNANTSWYII